MEYGLLGILILALDIIAIVGVIQSSLEPIMKLLWIVVILALPLLGMLLWFIIGGQKARTV